jgi:hypothetical protein
MLKDTSSPEFRAPKSLVYEKKRDLSARRNLTPSRQLEIVQKFENFKRSLNETPGTLCADDLPRNSKIPTKLRVRNRRAV